MENELEYFIKSHYFSEPQVDKAYLNFEPPEKPQVCPKPEQMMICPACSGTGKVPQSLPFQPELLTDEEIKRQIIGLEDKGIVYCCQVVLGYYNLKCHQSEAARIKELEQFQFELNHKLHETELTIGQIRADQNKKIGEDLTKILLDDTIKNSISRCRTITDYVADNLIAKLQKGKEVE